MPQLINSQASNNAMQENRKQREASKQTTLFRGYRFAKMFFIVECAFNATMDFDINYIRRNELKFQQTSNTKRKT